uniref:Uncharacterized protein n=1 Tax=Odontella aurita TaxID=265563 RepID=A0A7S4HV70_9STRA|mmetsp:Transcript_15596/g.45033  ORF Transcript_15596/g.45033 Transcript_15596/m.45033 type:complete len:511 (+) Transcript_15596:114-1646(+)
MVNSPCSLCGNSLFQLMHTDIIAYVLSFATNDGDDVHDLLQLLLAPSSPLGDYGSDSDEESVFRALCQLHWRSTSTDRFEDEWRPSLGTWRTTYCVLQTWVPREGFYSVVEAAPWGMLVRLRFECGQFVGDILWPHEEADASNERGPGGGRLPTAFQFIRVLTVSFSEDGTGEISLCGIEEGLGAADVIEASTTRLIKPIVLPHWPGQLSIGSAGGALQLVLPPVLSSAALAAGVGDSSYVEERFRDDDARYHLWDPATTATPLEMFRSLWEHRPNPEGRKLTLDWIDGPMRDDTFQYTESMPVIKPGLYSGVYVPEEYGKFKREVIMIEYRKYEMHDSESDTNDATWDKIQRDAFNFPEQMDDNGFLNQVKSAVHASDTKEIVFVLGRKVTGDYHVPMQRVTFGALVHPQLNSENAPPHAVTDKGGDGIEYKVVNSWAGWGTLAYPGFLLPTWAIGTLVQVEHPNRQHCKINGHTPQKFGFMWESDGTGTHETTILSRMPEQDEFPWFT